MVVELRITHPETGDSLDFYSENISSEGVFVETDHFYGLQNNLNIAIFLLNAAQERFSSHRHISVKGDVVRQEAEGFAIRFHKNYRFM